MESQRLCFVDLWNDDGTVRVRELDRVTVTLKKKKNLSKTRASEPHTVVTGYVSKVENSFMVISAGDFSSFTVHYCEIEKITNRSEVRVSDRK